MREIDDGVAVGDRRGRGIEDEGILARTASQRIQPRAAPQGVGPARTVQDIVAGNAIQHVRPTVTGRRIVTRAPS